MEVTGWVGGAATVEVFAISENGVLTLSEILVDAKLSVAFPFKLFSFSAVDLLFDCFS